MDLTWSLDRKAEPLPNVRGERSLKTAAWKRERAKRGKHEGGLSWLMNFSVACLVISSVESADSETST